MQTQNYVAVLAVSKQREFANEMRSLLSETRDIDLASFAETHELALLSAKQCSVILIDAHAYDTTEINKLTCALRIQVPTAKIIVVYAANVPQIILSHIQCGIIGFFFRGDSAERLAELIWGAEAGRAYISDTMVAQLIQRLGELRNQQRICGRTTRKISYQELEGLSRREREVFSLVSQGMSNRQIADHLIIEYGTVKNHVHKILKKLGVDNRQEVAAIHSLMAKPIESSSKLYAYTSL